MHALGIDVGYGHTKALSSLGTQLTFPSVVGLAEAQGYHLELNGRERPVLHGGLVTRTDGMSYLYGEPAVRYARLVHQPRDRHWIRSDPYRVLWEAVMTSLVLPATHPLIVTGLPVRYYTADREALAALVRQVLAERDIQAAAVIVVPQPFGSFFDRILDPQGHLAADQHPDAHLGIIDIGHFTTDFVEVQDCEYIEKGSGSLEVGVATVLDMLRRVAYEEWGRSLDASECEAALRGTPIRVKGKSWDVRSIVETACRESAAAIVATARQLWAGGEALDELLVTGGGGSLFAPLLHPEFSHLTLLPEAFLANAREYMRYALYRGRDDA